MMSDSEATPERSELGELPSAAEQIASGFVYDPVLVPRAIIAMLDRDPEVERVELHMSEDGLCVCLCPLFRPIDAEGRRWGSHAAPCADGKWRTYRIGEPDLDL